LRKARHFIPLLLFFLSCSLLRPVVFYVSPQGNDDWSGRKTLSRASQHDGPFATLERAHQALRQSGDRQRTVVIEPGVYSMTQGLVLDSLDSGTKRHPVVWRAAGKVQLVGARVVQEWQPLQEPALLNRLPSGARSEVLVIDLDKEGIGKIAEMSQRGSPPLELFCHNQRMTMARFPNEGWLLIADVPQTGAQRFNQGLEREKRFDGVPVGRHYGRIRFSETAPCQWSMDNDIYVHGFWTWDWSDSYQKVAAIDAGKKEIIIAEPHHHYGYTKNQRYYFLNVLEELDKPGEWVLDRKNRRIYFWPPQPLLPGDVKISVLTEPLLTMRDLNHVQWQGMDSVRPWVRAC